MRLVKIFVFFGIAFIAGNCGADKCFKKSGSINTETEEFDSFSVIQVRGIFNVELVQDTIFYVEKIAPQQVLKGIDLELYKDTLTCYNYNNCFWRRDFDRPSLRIHFNDIYELNIFEASNVFSLDSITDDFRFTIRSNIAEANLIFNNKSVFFYINKHSGGRFTFRGKTQNAFLMNFNTGLFLMDELQCKKALVRNYSVVDMKVNVTDELKAEIYNSGNIFYRGAPEVIIDTISSTGRVLPLN